MSSNPVTLPLRFAVIGCGNIHGTHTDAIAGLGPEVGRLVAVCDETPEIARKAGEKFGVPYFRDLDRMIGSIDFDVLSVCTPSGLHAAVGTVGAKAGKHIVCEKPIDVSLKAADELIQACKASGVKLEVISQHRYSAGVQTLRRWLDEGRFGKLVYGESVTKWYRTQAYYDSGGWRGTWELDGGGALTNQGVHYVDLLRYTMGPVKSVAATMGTLAHERIEVEDIVSATIEFKNGAVGTLLASTAMYPGYKQSLEVYGTHGTVLIDDSRIRHAQFADGTEEQGMFSVKAKPPEVDNFVAREDPSANSEVAVTGAADPTKVWGEGHLAHYRDLVDAIQTGRETFMNGQEARNALELIIAVYESARSGKRVSLPL